jgi:hypothetical protein
MKTSKNIIKICLVVAYFGQLTAQAATIGFSTTFGVFKTSAGLALNAGGVSIGYFTVALPTASQLLAMTNPWADLAGSSYGYKDVRILLDSSSALPTFQTGGTWDYSAGGGIGGTLNVPNSPINVTNAINGNDSLSTFLGGTTGTATQLWAFAFNAGNYANGYSGSTQWAVVTANAFGQTLNEWLYPTSSENIMLSQINAPGEVLVGSDPGGNDVLMAAIIPEPASASLLGLGLLFIHGAVCRRKPQKA